jgi:hypothetical protein
MYILKLLLNVVTIRIEALVVSGNKFLYASVKEVCCLWAQPCFDTYHPILIIDEVLWSQPVLQAGKQVVVTQSEIRAVRMMVKQLPVEMVQQCSRASSCMRTHFVMEKHYTRCQHSTPFVLFGPMQFFLVFSNTLVNLLWSLVAWIPPSELLSCPRKQLSSALW